ncbi:MAG TPA: GNAT family N-acetyltransferase [Gemmatimonadaceae bacterium]|nr:GNAT family N-acetyltransferase [Gemmatimonadaceae bacterium]
MAEALSIRAATAADLPTIKAMIFGLAEYERLLDECEATEERLRSALFGSPRYAECVIARIGDTPVGFALFFHNFSTFAARPGIYLEDLFVLPEHRGQGVGGELLRHLARLAVERNCARFEWAVLDWNAPAIKFYTSLGARPMNDWTVFRVTGEALQELAR